ncbi:hypothetical protein A2837_03380 [Candidatus Kaiserbacteria bacterium RIFCSPHIGHO2_01_FULL_46_22]|uniref:CYTH domain-containing protein n=1 Tax=Candidatus Kaiserbacteria bacterium RIFCSPHIGHO2_01_FULL_46_22 TaxID=1798475 RepID=A0A1F6BX45_9BACT|nr:MAG: hypothetical protein A2837_03380 [Candidatus Kaiserbacteria bacterium RIFCSPHIGHO2_01_FULL_46_22]
MNTFEIEVKSLLGEESKAKELLDRMAAQDPDFKKTSANKQLNHYFEGGDMRKLIESVSSHLNEEQFAKLQHIVETGKDFSIRTRQKNDEVLLVVKASVDEGTSANTVSRLEFEEKVNLSLDALDGLVQSAGFKYQAKWSREREEYKYKGMTVCLDKNAGYGYLAEFEKVITDEGALADARAEIDTVMKELGVDELPQDRLERMFSHYNQNWPDYYGTDKVFVIE